MFVQDMLYTISLENSPLCICCIATDVLTPITNNNYSLCDNTAYEKAKHLQYPVLLKSIVLWSAAIESIKSSLADRCIRIRLI